MIITRSHDPNFWLWRLTECLLLMLAKAGELLNPPLDGSASNPAAATGQARAHEEREARFLRALRENARRLEQICYAFHQNHASREDLYQDIVAELWQKFDTYEGKSQLGTWIHAIALRIAREPLRKDRLHMRRVKYTGDSPDTLSDEPGQEQSDRLFTLMQQVGKADRMMLVLMLLEYKPAEIAAIMNVTVNTIDKRMSRIRQEQKDEDKNETNQQS